MARSALHPLLVQFPLALWGMSFVFDVLSLRYGPAMAEAARFNLAGGLVAALFAAATGARDFLRRLEPRSPARRLGRYHAALNALAAALFAASLIARHRLPPSPSTRELPLVLSALGVVVLGASAYLGGVLMFNLTRSARSPRGRP
ncbi:MAG TPA: DUF2231 domain-containing protein [Polyangia bacterium]|nr:DUF2231 domain-containing protein [Polyangia bacterium]